MKQLFSRPLWPQQLLLAAIVLATIVSSLFLQRWHQQQTAIQIQLLANSASLLSIEPLQQKQSKGLEVTLHALQQHSALPIRAIAVFDRAQRVFASTSKAESWLEQAAQSLDTEHSQLNDATVQLISTPIWADRRVVSEHTNPATVQTPDTSNILHQPAATLLPPPAISSKQLGYLLILIDKSSTPMLQVFAPLILLLLLAIFLLWLTARNIANSQLLQIELVAKKLANDELLSSDAEPLLKPLVVAWQEKNQQFERQLNALKQDSQVEWLKLENQLQLSQQKAAQLATQQLQIQSQLQSTSSQLSYWQLLVAEAERLSPSHFTRQLKLLAFYTRLKDPDFMVQPDALSLPDWLLQCYDEQLDDGRTNHFIFEEDPQAYAFKVNLDPELLAHLIGLFVSICRQLATEPEIIFSYHFVESPGKQLKFKMKYVGRGLPARWRQVLASAVDKLLPEDLEVELCRYILQLLQGQLQIDSIDDVGTQLEISLPVSWQKTNATKQFQSILLVDEKDCRLPLIKQSLVALGEQVHSCHAYSSLETTLQRRLVDLLVLVLPPQPDQLKVSIAELSALSQRVQVQSFAPAAAVSQWQSLLSFPVSPLPLLIGKLLMPQSLPLAQQQLLVVDDNQTNLSYVRAVLAMEGLRIDIAMTGEEAVKMASNNRYQLILMDIQLPDLPGTEVTKQIRQLRHHQQTIILAFTAHAMPDEIASFRLAGMDDVLIKPLDTKKIAHILGRIKALDQSK